MNRVQRKLVSPISACIVFCLSAIPMAAFICGSTWPPPSVCQLAATHDVIFVATVIETQQISQIDGPGFGHFVMRVKLKITEPFKGLARNTKTLDLEYPLADESFEFARDTTYIVYAFRQKNGSLEVSGCGPSRPVRWAKEDISYFRSLGPRANEKSSCSP